MEDTAIVEATVVTVEVTAPRVATRSDPVSLVPVVEDTVSSSTAFPRAAHGR